MTILLVTGPSGAGKDSLLSIARDHYRDNSRMHFANRYVTRRPDENEQNYFVEQAAFLLLRGHGYFVSHWQAHGNLYGVPKTELNGCVKDRVTVVSISRTKIADFERQFERVVTLNITVPPEVLRKRLQARKREDCTAIDKRLRRNTLSVHARQTVRFDNSEELSISGTRFLALLDSFLTE